MGYIYAEEGQDLDRAISLIKKAVELDPANGAYMDSLGWAYYKKGMLEEALAEVEKALKALPDDPVVISHLGDIYYAKGEVKKAIKEWQKALKLNPKNKRLRQKINEAKKQQ